MKKFKKVTNIAKVLKENGWDNLDRNISILTSGSQDIVNQWCQEELDNILE